MPAPLQRMPLQNSSLTSRPTIPLLAAGRTSQPIEGSRSGQRLLRYDHACSPAPAARAVLFSKIISALSNDAVLTKLVHSRVKSAVPAQALIGRISRSRPGRTRCMLPLLWALRSPASSRRIMAVIDPVVDAAMDLSGTLPPGSPRAASGYLVLELSSNWCVPSSPRVSRSRQFDGCEIQIIDGLPDWSSRTSVETAGTGTGNPRRSPW